MASKPIKKVLSNIRNGKSIALAIAESDLDPEERDILVMSILDVVRETKRLETREEWAERMGLRMERIETAITALIDHERKTRDAFVAMTDMFEAVLVRQTAEVARPNPVPVGPIGAARLRVVQPATHHLDPDDPFTLG